MKKIPLTAFIGVGVLATSLTAWLVWGIPLESSTAYAAGGRTALGLQLDGPFALLSAAFLHRDPQHLIWNLLPGLPLLFLLERRMGRFFLLALALSSMTVGLLAGHLGDGKAAVGFSPVVFAALGVFIALPKNSMPLRLVWLVRIYTVFAVAASFRMPNVDENSHLLGLIVGSLLTLLARTCPPWTAPSMGLALTASALAFPMTMTMERTSWSPPQQGLSLAPPQDWRQPSPARRNERCAPGLDLCVVVQTSTSARVQVLGRGRDGLAPSLLLEGADEAIVEPDEAGQPCLQIRRGLYQHQVCVVSTGPLRQLAQRVLNRWFLDISFSRPGTQKPEQDALLAALEEHRLGRLVHARLLYQRALLHRPDDAKVPFLYALLEADFGDRNRAQTLASQAVYLDPAHPAGRALLRELESQQ